MDKKSKKNLQRFGQLLDCNQNTNCSSTGNQFSNHLVSDSVLDISGNMAVANVSISGIPSIQMNMLLVDDLQLTYYTNTGMQLKDGMIGLGKFDQNNKNDIPYVMKLQKKGIIQDSVFSLFLSKNGTGSELTFGGFNPSNVLNTSEIYFFNTTFQNKFKNKQAWYIKIDSICLFSSCVQNITALIDPYSKNITMSQKIIIEFYKQSGRQIQDQMNFTQIQFWQTDCSDSYFDIKLQFSDINGRHHSKFLNSSVQKYSNLMDVYTKCGLDLHSILDDNVDFQIVLGSPFLSEYVSIFSYANNTIGLTTPILPSDTDSSSSFDYEVLYYILIPIGAFILFPIFYYYNKKYKICKYMNIRR
ncbi:hypothetical protein ABPG74_012789 [Tetrahymena malaccensis]